MDSASQAVKSGEICVLKRLIQTPQPIDVQPALWDSVLDAGRSEVREYRLWVQIGSDPEDVVGADCSHLVCTGLEPLDGVEERLSDSAWERNHPTDAQVDRHAVHQTEAARDQSGPEKVNGDA
jgi:hypothetical protein